MSDAVVAPSPVEVDPPQRKILRIAAWIVGTILALVVLHVAGDRRSGLVRGPVGHPHRDLDRLHRPGLSLPGTPDGAHGARVVRNPPLRVSGRRHVHAGAGGLRDGCRAQQLRAREHGHLRDAPHVRRHRQGVDVPGCPRRIRRPEDLLPRHRHADLRLPLQCSRRVVRLPVRQRAGRAVESPRAHARNHRRSDLPPCSPASCLLDLGQEDVGEGGAGRRHPPRPRRVREARAASRRWAATQRR